MPAKSKKQRKFMGAELARRPVSIVADGAGPEGRSAPKRDVGQAITQPLM
jgi:hypothetical protein